MNACEGQLEVLFMVCRNCGQSVDDSYGVSRFQTHHAAVEPGVCAEMAWSRRGYLHAVWAVDNFASWYTLAQPGTDLYETQLSRFIQERDRFRDRCIKQFARVGAEWLEAAQ